MLFLGAVRLKDFSLLASGFEHDTLNQERSEVETRFVDVVRDAGAVHPGWREKSSLNHMDGVLYAMADQTGIMVYGCALRDKDYPERLALQLLRDLCDKFRNTQGDQMLETARPGTLSKPMKKQMRDLMKQYDDVESQDKASEVQAKVNQIQGIMQDNVKRILESHQTMDTLESRSANMSTQANQFLRQSVDLRRQMQWRDLKLKIISGVVISSALAYVVFSVVDF